MEYRTPIRIVGLVAQIWSKYWMTLLTVGSLLLAIRVCCQKTTKMAKFWEKPTEKVIVRSKLGVPISCSYLHLPDCYLRRLC